MITKRLFLLTIYAILSLETGSALAGTTIYNFEGKASLRRDNTVYQADYDMPIRAKDILRSDKDGFIDISITKFAGAKILGASECQISRVDSSNKALILNYGIMQVNLAPLTSDASFAVETPIAIVSVDGAQFTPEPKNNLYMIVHIKKTGTSPAYTAVYSRQGNLNVHVKETHTAVTVLEGRMVKVEEHAFAPTVRNASEDELKPLEKANSIYITED